MSEREETAYFAAPTRVRPRTLFRVLRRRLPRGAFGFIGALASVALFLSAAFLLGRVLSQISYGDLARALQRRGHGGLLRV
ncbi:MAG: hypothetical protein N2444_09955 [Methylocystis sp.]|nr:hypothetical protein [Methylocystis sp.]